MFGGYPLSSAVLVHDDLLGPIFKVPSKRLFALLTLGCCADEDWSEDCSGLVGGHGSHFHKPCLPLAGVGAQTFTPLQARQ